MEREPIKVKTRPWSAWDYIRTQADFDLYAAEVFTAAYRAGQEDMKRRAVEVAYSAPDFVSYEAARAIASLEVRDK